MQEQIHSKFRTYMQKDEIIRPRSWSTCCFVMKGLVAVCPLISVFISKAYADALTQVMICSVEVLADFCLLFQMYTTIAGYSMCLCQKSHVFASYFQASNNQSFDCFIHFLSFLSSLHTDTNLPRFQLTVYCSLKNWKLYMTGSCVLKTPLQRC